MSEENVKCPKCGKEFELGKKFCPSCGCRLPEKKEDISLKSKNNMPDYIKYIIGGVIAVLLLVAIPFANIFMKSYNMQSQFKNYKKEVEFVMQEIDNAIDRQYQIDKKYYYNQDAITNKVLKKQLPYENLPNGSTKFNFTNDFYLIVIGSRSKCDLFVEDVNNSSACEHVNVYVPVSEKSNKKFGKLGQDNLALKISIYPNRTVKFGNW